MDASARTPVTVSSATRPRRPVVVAAWLSAGWCVAFATANVVLELTGHFTRGALGAYASGLSVMDWLMVCLKLVGAGLALLSIRRQSIVPVRLLGTLLWGAFATLAIYATGNVVESAGMLAGIIHVGRPIRPLDVGYVVFFAVAAALFGVVTVSYARRNGLRLLPVVLGVVGAPALIAGVLVAAPLALNAAGLFPR